MLYRTAKLVCLACYDMTAEITVGAFFVSFFANFLRYIKYNRNGMTVLFFGEA
jgi:hypothetical protein